MAASTTLRPDNLFDWAEKTYPQHFPGHANSQIAAPYLYRHYPTTGNYVGVDGQNVYVLGPVSGGTLSRVGSLTDFTCYVTPNDCPSPPLAMPVRRRVSDGTADYNWVVTDDGSVLAFGDTAPVHPASLISIPGSLAKKISGLERVVAVHSWGRMHFAVTSRGELWGWGYHDGFLTGRTGLAEDFTRVPLKVPNISRVLDVDVRSGFLMFLRDDGTVWWADTRSTPGRVVVKQLVGLNNIVALDLGDPFLVWDGRGSSLQRSDGKIVAVNASTLSTLKVAGVVTGLPSSRNLSCSLYHCVMADSDGNLLTWGENKDGQLGDGSTFPSSRPIRISQPTNVRRVRACGAASFAITDNNELWAWGSAWGTGWGRTFESPSLVPVKIADSRVGVVELSCRNSQFAVLADGSLWAIGVNWRSELGLPSGQINEFTRVPNVQAVVPLSSDY